MATRRSVGLLAVGAAAILGITACSSGSATAPEGSAAAKNGKSVSADFIVGAAGEPYFNSMVCGAEAEAQKLGATTDVFYGNDYSVSSVTALIDAAIARQPNAILVQGVSSTALDSSLQQAAKAGIKVVVVDSPIQATSFLAGQITSNNLQGGKLAAEGLAKQLGGKGQVLIEDKIPGQGSEEQRLDGFLDQIKKYPGIQIVGTTYTQDSAALTTSATTSYIARYPDLAGIYATDGPTAEGAVAGLRQAGKLGKVRVASIDSEPPLRPDFTNGWLQVWVAQQPTIEGTLAMETAVDAVRGETKPVFQQISMALVTQENANSLVYSASANC
jgi:ribose transport system substrate-binding protein